MVGVTFAQEGSFVEILGLQWMQEKVEKLEKGSLLF